MRSDIYKAVARIHNVSEEEVRSEIQKAIEEAYTNSRALADKIPSEGEIPTSEEVIAYIISQL